MNRQEDRLAEIIDRQRLAPVNRARRDARKRVIRVDARSKMRLASAVYACPDERAEFLKDCLDMVAEQLHPLIGRVQAATAFNSRAADICGPLRLEGASARARAEHAFARATAFSDGGDQ